MNAITWEREVPTFGLNFSRFHFSLTFLQHLDNNIYIFLHLSLTSWKPEPLPTSPREGG